MSYISKYTGKEIDELLDKVSNGDSAPTGNIISFMGTKAPKGYLICDGAEYNIADYPKLANHFAEQFENIAYFGGDGINTFKVPDLRNEFLRGYHGETEALSGEIGEHQDATKHKKVITANGFIAAYCSTTDLEAEINPDTRETAGTTILSAKGVTGSNTTLKYYTSRPTNVAVLYCIKY